MGEHDNRLRKIAELWGGHELSKSCLLAAADHIESLEARVRELEAVVEHIAKCVVCGGFVDTRELDEGGALGGCQLSNGDWTCSEYCWHEEVERLEMIERIKAARQSEGVSDATGQAGDL